MLSAQFLFDVERVSKHLGLSAAFCFVIEYIHNIFVGKLFFKTLTDTFSPFIHQDLIPLQYNGILASLLAFSF